MNGRALGDRAIEVSPSSARVLERAAEILTPFPVRPALNFLTISQAKIGPVLETGRVRLAASATFNAVRHASDADIHPPRLKPHNQITLAPCLTIRLLYNPRLCRRTCRALQARQPNRLVPRQCLEVFLSALVIGNVE
jgi:hypothetical protein